MAVLVCDGVEVARWRVPLAGRPALEVVAEVASLRLAAKRRGCEIRLAAPCDLGVVLGAAGFDGSVEPVGEAERVEELGVPVVQEVVVPDDPLA